MEYELDIDEKEHASGVLQRLDCMRGEGKRCNFTIKVGTEELQVHRDILVAASPYFEAMLSHDNLENKSGCVEMKDVTFDMVEKCIRFIYTGKASISFEKCEYLLYLANLLQLTLLREKIGFFLRRYLTVSSLFEIKKIADKFEVESLKNFCIEFGYENIDFITKEEEFLDVDISYVSSVITFRKSSELGQEDPKLCLILVWVRGDEENRSTSLAALIHQLDLTKVSSTYSRYLVENDSLCYQSLDCLKMLCIATMDKYGVKKRKDCKPYGNPNALIVFDLESNILQAYMPEENHTWIKMQNLHEDMHSGFYTAVATKRFIFVLMESGKLFRLDVLDKEAIWKELKNMSEKHGNNLRAAILNDVIYVAGNNCMEKYSIRRNEWEKVDSEGIVLNGGELVACQGAIFSLGGCDGSENLTATNKFDPELQTWQRVEPMPSVIKNLTATNCYGELYAFCLNKKKCYRYDLATNSWTTVSPLPSCVVFQAVAGLYLAIETHFGCTGLSRRIHMWLHDLTWRAVSLLPSNEIGPMVAMWLPGK